MTRDSRFKLTQPATSSPTRRQSPITDVATLTIMVLESYELTFVHSSPKVHKRYEKLLRQLKARK